MKKDFLYFVGSRVMRLAMPMIFFVSSAAAMARDAENTIVNPASFVGNIENAATNPVLFASSAKNNAIQKPIEAAKKKPVNSSNSVKESAISKMTHDGFFSTVSSDIIFFPKNGQHDLLIAPSLGIVSGYQGQIFSVSGGFTYYFYNFYGKKDVLIHFGGAYNFRFPIGEDKFFALGVGANLARSLYTSLIIKDNNTMYFFTPEVSMQIFLASFTLNIYSRIYIPLQRAPELGYGLGAMMGVVF